MTYKFFFVVISKPTFLDNVLLDNFRMNLHSVGFHVPLKFQPPFTTENKKGLCCTEIRKQASGKHILLPLVGKTFSDGLDKHLCLRIFTGEKKTLCHDFSKIRQSVFGVEFTVAKLVTPEIKGTRLSKTLETICLNVKTSKTPH